MRARHLEPADGGTARPTALQRTKQSGGLLALQRAAGNSAVRTLVMRDDTGQETLPGFSATAALRTVGQLRQPVQEAVDRWLEGQTFQIRLDAFMGTTSLPEVVDKVRRSVPAAADASPFAIERRVAAIIGTLPTARGPAPATQQAQVAAQIANLFAKVPTKVDVNIGPGELTVGIQGAEFAMPGAKIAADHEGAEGEVKAGPVTVKGEGSWAEKSGGFGFKTNAGPVRLSGKVEVGEGQKWKWSGGLSLPLTGDHVGKVPDVTKAVGDAHDAIYGAAKHVASGGSPTDPEVTGTLKKVTPALTALGKVAEHGKKTGVSLGVDVSGSSEGGWTAGVSVIVVF